jgi:hypothetical protein
MIKRLALRAHAARATASAPLSNAGRRVLHAARIRRYEGGARPISGQNCFQRLQSLHMKPWIIAALICSASAAYAAEDDNRIHPTCVEENNTRRCWVDHGPPAGVRPPQLQPVAPAPQAAIPPPPPRWLPPPLIFRFGPYGLIVPRRYPAPPAGRAPAY